MKLQSILSKANTLNAGSSRTQTFWKSACLGYTRKKKMPFHFDIVSVLQWCAILLPKPRIHTKPTPNILGLEGYRPSLVGYTQNLEYIPILTLMHTNWSGFWEDTLYVHLGMIDGEIDIFRYTNFHFLFVFVSLYFVFVYGYRCSHPLSSVSSQSCLVLILLFCYCIHYYSKKGLRIKALLLYL